MKLRWRGVRLRPRATSRVPTPRHLRPCPYYDDETAPTGREVIVRAGVGQMRGWDPCGRPPWGSTFIIDLYKRRITCQTYRLKYKCREENSMASINWQMNVE